MNNLGIYDGQKQIAGLTRYDRLIDYVFYSDSNEVHINYKFHSSCLGGSCFNYSSFYIKYEELDNDISPDQIKQTSTCNDFQFHHYTKNYSTISSPWIGLNPKALRLEFKLQLDGFAKCYCW